MSAPSTSHLCSRCRTKRYTDKTAQLADWARHKHECLPWDAPSTSGELRLQHLVDPLSSRRLFGPYRTSADAPWQLPLSEPAILTTMCDITHDARIVSAEAHKDARFWETHRQLGVAHPKQMTAVYTRIWDESELGRCPAPKPTLPDHAKMSPYLYWPWFASGKCEVYVMAMMWAMDSLTAPLLAEKKKKKENDCEDEESRRYGLGIPFRFRNEDVVEWGTAPVCFVKTFLPVARTFAFHPSTMQPTDIDQLSDGCAHRVFYFSTKAHMVYVDLAPAQYGVPTHSEHAQEYPMLVCVGDEELRKYGFVPHPTDPRQANTDDATWESFQIKMWTCPPHYSEGVRSLAGTLFQHLAACVGADVTDASKLCSIDYPKPVQTAGRKMLPQMFAHMAPKKQ